VHPELIAALAKQFAQWQVTLEEGAERVGWKLGLGDRERIGGEPALGHLTSATTLAPGSSYVAHARAELHADAELAVELGSDHQIAGYAVALELVDLARPPGDPRTAVVENVFHRAVAFGPIHPELPTHPIETRLVVNGHMRASATDKSDAGPKIQIAARLVSAMGEELRAGDRIITGSIVQVPVGAGDDVSAEIDGLGEVRLSVTGLASHR
jgi:2-keto-4-pentenoate hydratase